MYFKVSDLPKKALFWGTDTEIPSDWNLPVIDRTEYIKVLDEYMHRGSWEKPLLVYAKECSGKRRIFRSSYPEHAAVSDIPFRSSTRYLDSDGIVKPVTEEMRNEFVLPESINPLESSPILYEYGVYSSSPVDEKDIKYCCWLLEHTHRPVIMLCHTANLTHLPNNIEQVEPFHFVCTKDNWVDWAMSVNENKEREYLSNDVIGRVRKMGDDFYNYSPFHLHSIAIEAMEWNSEDFSDKSSYIEFLFNRIK